MPSAHIAEGVSNCPSVGRPTLRRELVDWRAPDRPGNEKRRGRFRYLEVGGGIVEATAQFVNNARIGDPTPRTGIQLYCFLVEDRRNLLEPIGCVATVNAITS